MPAGSRALGQGPHSSRFRTSPYTSLPFQFFGDSFNLDDIYSTGYPVASQPPIALLQTIRAIAGLTDPMAQLSQTPTHDNDRNPSASQPLVIELQNGRYVRLGSTPSNGEPLPQTLAPGHALLQQVPPSKSVRNHSTSVVASNPNPAPTIAAPSPQSDLPPALLIFRDGHHEEVRDYTIASGILYARGDYYTDGYWNKKIDLSTLDVPQTQQANATRNVKFTLPTSPNEVITRP
jgi:hypothetical protein